MCVTKILDYSDIVDDESKIIANIAYYVYAVGGVIHLYKVSDN